MNQTLASTSLKYPVNDSNWKAIRKLVTVRYGYYTLAITLALLLIIPSWDRTSLKLTPRGLRRITRRIPFRFGSSGALGIFILAALALSLCETQWDLRFVAARLGRVPTYCLPTILLLTLRPSPLPQTLYLQLIPLHKWMSRLIVLQGFLHSVFYVWYICDSGKISKLWRFNNLTGFAALGAFLVIVITSLPWIRRSAYRFFFVNHYCCTWIAVISLYFHARPGIPFLTLTNVCILVYQVARKFSLSRITKVQVYDVSASIEVVELPNWAIKCKSSLPGCHIRIIDFPSHNLLKRLYNGVLIPEQHPYTLATMPSDGSQKLIVKKGDFVVDEDTEYLVTGSFLPFLRFVDSANNSNPESLRISTSSRKCLIVVGGSAISFALPILRVLSYNGVTVKIVWVVRDHEDLRVLNHFKNVLVSDDCIDIFISGNYSDYEKICFRDALTRLRKRRVARERAREQAIMGLRTLSTRHRSDPVLGDKRAEDDLDLEMGLNKAVYKRNGLHHSTQGAFKDESKFEDVDLELNGLRRTTSLPHISARTPLISNRSTDYLSTEDTPSAGYSGEESAKPADSSYDNLADYWVLEGLSCRIDFGRPTLGLYYYNWSIGSSCGPEEDQGCFNQSEDDMFQDANFIQNRRARIRDKDGQPDEDIWVVGAGPKGLVNKVRMWADNCGFRFHEESFSV